MAVLIGSFFFFDAVEVMMDEMFSLSNRQQMTLSLSREQTLAAIDNARSLPGVLAVEGGYAVPVRLSNGARESLQSLQARANGTELARVLDHNREPFVMPSRGLVLPELLARELGARAGDFARRRVLLPGTARPTSCPSHRWSSNRWARRPTWTRMRCMRSCARNHESIRSISSSTKPSFPPSTHRSRRRRRSAAWRSGARSGPS